MNKEQTGVYVQFNMLRKEDLEKFSEREGGGGVEGYLFFLEGVGNLFSVIFNK